MTLIFTNNLSVPYAFVLYEGRVLELGANESQEVEFTDEELLSFVNYHKPSIVTQEVATASDIKNWVAGIDKLTINNIVTISTKEKPAEVFIPYLKFTLNSDNPCYLVVKPQTSQQSWTPKPSMEYSLDGINWSPFIWSMSSPSLGKFNKNGDVIYVRGNNLTFTNTTNFMLCEESDSFFAENYPVVISGSYGALFNYNYSGSGKIEVSLQPDILFARLTNKVEEYNMIGIN